jgi:hypothetical protein
MPGSMTTPSRADTHNNASFHVAFHPSHGVGARDQNNFTAQWLACTHPYRRFADTLAFACARLGADVVCYSFIAVDSHSHHFLLTAHSDEVGRAFRIHVGH